MHVGTCRCELPLLVVDGAEQSLDAGLEKKIATLMLAVSLAGRRGYLLNWQQGVLIMLGPLEACLYLVLLC